MDQPDFQNSPLEHMVAVGATDAQSCRIWVKANHPGNFRLTYRAGERSDSVQFEIGEGNRSDNTCSLQIPGEGQPPLNSLTRYEFQVTNESNGETIGSGSFETFPAGVEETPDRFSIAFMSCNQPFNKDGSVNPDSQSMMRAARRAMQQHDCKLLLEVGDQMYSDCPNPLSLFDDKYFQSLSASGRERLLDCPPEEIRSLFHRRYRHFFGFESWQDIHANYPSYPILDDHDIVDNWGSVKEHQNPEWQSLWQGARSAYCDYQASRIVPEPGKLAHFDYPIVYGNIAIYVLDLRSNRASDGGLISKAQFEQLEDFLASHSGKQALFLVLSVPAIHLPRWASRIASAILPVVEDFADRWSAPGHLADRNRILKMIYEHQSRHPAQPVILLGGDIHIGCAHQILWKDGTRPLCQFVSSAISHGRKTLESIAAKLSIQMHRHINIDRKNLRGAVRRIPAVSKSMQNPYGGLNLGIVQLTRSDDQTEIRYFMYGHQDGAPLCVYESTPIVAPDTGQGPP